MFETENNTTSTTHLPDTKGQNLSVDKHLAETGDWQTAQFSGESTEITLVRHGRELGHLSDQITAVEKAVYDLMHYDQEAFKDYLHNLQDELTFAKQQDKEYKEIHLEGARAYAYQAWKVLKQKQRYRSHALNFILTLLSHNPSPHFSDDILQMLSDLALEIERNHVNQETMKAYTRLAIRLGLTFGAH